LCARTLRVFAAGVNVYQRCPGCGGAWVTPEAIRDMVRAMSPGAEGLDLQPRGATAAEPTRRCPTCREEMRQVEVVARPGAVVVPLDTCPLHGVWFDNRELEAVLKSAGWPERSWLGSLLARFPL
jgi:Zn-finger nucleic acid-binding protein